MSVFTYPNFVCNAKIFQASKFCFLRTGVMRLANPKSLVTQIVSIYTSSKLMLTGYSLTLYRCDDGLGHGMTYCEPKIGQNFVV